MKTEEWQGSAPTCALSCDDFWVDCSLQGSRCIGGCNQLSSRDWLLPGSQVSLFLLLVGHSSLHQAFASVSQRKPLLAELPEVFWDGSWHCFHSAHWKSTLVTGGGLCASLYHVFTARPAWPLQDCSFLPLCLLRVCFALFVGLWCTSIQLHARQAHGKMQRDFIKHEKGKSFIPVQCSFICVWKSFCSESW